MTKKFSLENNDNISFYIENLINNSPHNFNHFNELKKDSLNKNLPDIHLSNFELRHLEVLVQIIKPKLAFEFGTLAGASALAIARHLDKDGVLHTFEINENHAKLAEENFKKYGLNNIILHVGEALKILENFKLTTPIDFVFIDADKSNYLNYFKWVEPHLRSGSVVVADNVFGFGHVHSVETAPKKIKTMVKNLNLFNEYITKNENFLTTFLPTQEGLSISVRL
jgi:predicted O-methyltransferase YrrM